VCLYWKKYGTSKISLAVYIIIIIIRTVCHRQRQRSGGEVGRVQETFLLNTEGRWFESCLMSYFHTNIHLRKLPTPPCSSLDSGVIRRSRVMKFHFHAFSLNHVTERFLKLFNLIDFSDFRGSRTILTLRSSIIR